MKSNQRRPFRRAAANLPAMCRSIKKLRSAETPASDEEVREAALQFVRKVSGYSRPSQVNAAAFDRAVDEITVASRELLDSLRPTRAASAERA